MGEKKETLIPAMAFYHKDGFVSAWKQAIRFSGEGGRIATLPDIINARLATKPGSIPWERYFTTLTAEYLGVSRGGNPIIIVAHGVGPMATLDGILKAYSWQYKDKERSRRGGRISHEEFLKLESGFYGPVEIVDFNKIIRNKYAFYTFLTDGEAAMCDLKDLVRARLGPRWLEYLIHHSGVAREWHAAKGDGFIKEPLIIQMHDASNCSYEFTKRTDGQAIAHLLSISGLSHWMLGGRDYPNAPRGGSLACEVSCHEWYDGVRLVSIRNDAPVVNIHPGVDSVSDLLRSNWQQLMKPVSPPPNVGLRKIEKIRKNVWFTEYPKQGASMDTGEPEFHVVSLEKIGELVKFVTTIGGYHMFFRYDIKEVEAIAPRGANAYTIGDIEIVEKSGDPKHHCALIQFYLAEIDTSRRLTREDELYNDYETLMSLILKEK